MNVALTIVAIIGGLVLAWCVWAIRCILDTCQFISDRITADEDILDNHGRVIRALNECSVADGDMIDMNSKQITRIVKGGGG